MEMDLNMEWVKVQLFMRKRFDEILDVQTILYMIGLQELGKNHQLFKKEQKIDIIHIGVCTVLMPYGYYQKLGLDNEGWPHFKNIKKLPNHLVGESQDNFMKKAIIEYLNL
jgi:hypothetical protein